KRPVFPRPYHADHFGFTFLPESDVLSQRVPSRPQLPRHRFVNDHHPRRSLALFHRKIPSSRHRHAHRLEIARPHAQHIGARALFARGFSPSFRRTARHLARTTQWKMTHPTRRRHSGQVLHAFEQSPVEG